MKRCYIAGPVTGLPEKVYQANFRRAEIALTILGYEPVNPVTLPHDHDKSWQSYMREAITEMLTCDVLYVLTGWEDSKGASAEVALARALGMNIIFQNKLVFEGDE